MSINGEIVESERGRRCAMRLIRPTKHKMSAESANDSVVRRPNTKCHLVPCGSWSPHGEKQIVEENVRRAKVHRTNVQNDCRHWFDASQNDSRYYHLDARACKF
eukprot:Selendium_serpulae@DN6157_c7_g3_i3.p1